MEGILPPTAGEVRYRGEPLGARFREDAGILFQRTALQDFLTVRQSIALFRGLYAHGLEVDELVRLCALEKLARRDARKLSGGQQQRLLLAIALVNDPAVLFLDEPTTGLDPQARRNFWELVQSIKARRKTIILTTHYMEEAELLCDEIAIHDGDLIAQELRLLHVVGRQDDGLAARLDRLHQLPEIASRLRIESGGRLIEEQHRRIVDERDREQQPLLLAAGELAGVAPRELLQGAQADELIDLEPVGVEPPEQRDRLAHGEKVLQRGPLEENAGVLAKARAERLAAVAYLAGGRRQDPLHDLDGGGLAGAVRAEQAETDAFGHAERHAGHGGGAGVLLDEVLYFEDGGAHGRGILADSAAER